MTGACTSLRWAIAGLFPLLLGACAGLPKDVSLPVDDPYESTNRRVMAVSQEVLRPAAVFVKTAIPGPVHDRLHDFNLNLKEPRIFVNNVLQGRFEAAAKTGARFVANSIFGLAGLYDVASQGGLPQQSGDFGQTLFVWGVPEGPYVVRPYLGPATERDAIGSIVDMFSNPVGLALAPATAVTVGSAGVDAADRLGQLQMAEDASIDFYSFIRSAYYQMRRAELREAAGLPPAIDSPALDDPDAEPAGAATPGPEATGSATAPAPTAARSASKSGKSRSVSPPASHRSALAPAARVAPKTAGPLPPDASAPAPAVPPHRTGNS
jgi:phospholipid-binding lipoprotein MlaA